MMTDTIADFPTYRIYKAYQGRKFKHGDVIAIPFMSYHGGMFWHMFKLGTVAGYAIERGEDPEVELDRVRRQMVEDPSTGHKLHWANAMPVCIHNGPIVKEQYPGFEFGDKIILQGKVFMLELTHNYNCKLVAV